ncbi:Aste57867_15590 [Aphanomyces stellatus]|uniref:Aste57867_15590 protein n=1 Tax=Aphanomyces stellatus TaxID=120398 RepID=A0A485L3H0_9STRA|nr:hypothetical protein As57867_015534 [Aphanomyces stellatus]VFT92392.1 Aste57867_15590 [Aphanomyces stellatus]
MRKDSVLGVEGKKTSKQAKKDRQETTAVQEEAKTATDAKETCRSPSKAAYERMVTRTALVYAFEIGWVNVVVFLLSRDDIQINLLCGDVSYRWYDSFDWLSQTFVRIQNRKSALMYASENGRVEVARLMMDHVSVDIDLVDMLVWLSQTLLKETECDVAVNGKKENGRGPILNEMEMSPSTGAKAK